MQADSLLRINLCAHQINQPNIDSDGDEAEMTGILTDNQDRIHIIVNRYNNKKYNITINRYPSDTPKKRHHMITNYFDPTDVEKEIFDSFFASTPLPTIQQQLITLLTYWTNPPPAEHIDTLSRLIRRIPRGKMAHPTKDHILYYFDQQNQKNIYWDALQEIESWCPLPMYKYEANGKTWVKTYERNIISEILSHYGWNEHYPLSMHETIKLIRQAQALNIPSLPKDLSGMRK